MYACMCVCVQWELLQLSSKSSFIKSSKQKPILLSCTYVSLCFILWVYSRASAHTHSQMIAEKCHDLLFETFVNASFPLNSMPSINVWPVLAWMLWVLEILMLWNGFYIKLICFEIVSWRDRQTDRQTDRERARDMWATNIRSNSNSHKTILVGNVTHKQPHRPADGQKDRQTHSI